MVYLLGDATHGSSEFYRFRQQVTRELIVSHGVRHLVLEMEADEAARINDWLISSEPDTEDSKEILIRAIRHWPRWVWANREVAEFLDWLRDYNGRRPAKDRVQLHGMDLKELNNDVSAKYTSLIGEDPYAAWNFRSRYMAEVVLGIVAPENRTVVWAHNNHVGDKRADDTPGVTLVSVGQLIRESIGPDQTFVIGTAASEGAYIAASRWGEQWQRVQMEAALSGSVSHALTEAEHDRSLLFWQSLDAQNEWNMPVYHRGIGVISSRGASNNGTYVLTRIARRYDALGFFRWVDAVEPLR